MRDDGVGATRGQWEMDGSTTESCKGVKRVVFYVQVGKNCSPAASSAGGNDGGMVDSRTGRFGASLEHPFPTTLSHSQLPGEEGPAGGCIGAC